MQFTAVIDTNYEMLNFEIVPTLQFLVSIDVVAYYYHTFLDDCMNPVEI